MREAVQATFSLIVVRAQKRIAPHLKSLMTFAFTLETMMLACLKSQQHMAAGAI